MATYVLIHGAGSGFPAEFLCRVVKQRLAITPTSWTADICRPWRARGARPAAGGVPGAAEPPRPAGI